MKNFISFLKRKLRGYRNRINKKLIFIGYRIVFKIVGGILFRGKILEPDFCDEDPGFEALRYLVLQFGCSIYMFSKDITKYVKMREEEMLKSVEYEPYSEERRDFDRDCS